MELVLLFGIVVITLCALIFGVYAHTGLLHEVNVTAEEPREWSKVTIAYKFTAGGYSFQLFRDMKHLLPTYKKICIHYRTNARQGSQVFRACAVGFILSDAKKEPEEDLTHLMIELGYKIYTFPTVTYALNAKFPYRSDFYIKFARARVFSVLSAYIQARRLCAHPMIEIYDNSTIRFLVPLSRQDDFYVPEATACRMI